MKRRAYQRSCYAAVAVAVAVAIACQPRVREPAPPVVHPAVVGQPLALASAGRQEIGTAHPVGIIAASADGRWVAICETRRGAGSSASYLVRGAGQGDAIDALVAVSPDDRWLVVLRERRFVLIDDATG